MGTSALRSKVKAKTPTVLQLEAVECGAAALAIILAYHGRIEPLANLRRDCGVSRDGSKASNILKAARRYGLEAKAFSKTVPELFPLRAPFITFWNFNHFLVVEGFRKDKVFLNDPSGGHRTVSLEEFEKSFTGVVLTFKPTAEFKKGGRAPSLRRAIVSRLAGSLDGVAFCVLAGFLLVVPSIAQAGFYQIFLDQILLEKHTGWLRPLIIAMTVTLAVHLVLKALQLRYLRRLKIKLAMQMSSKFMLHLFALPSTFYAQRFSGEIANRSRLNDKLADVLSGRLARSVIDVAMMIFYAGAMFYYDRLLCAIGLAAGAANVLLLRWAGGRRVEANMRILQNYGKAQGTALAGLQNLETIKSVGLESKFFAKWAGYYAKASNARQDLELSNEKLSTLPSLFHSVTITLVLIVGAYRIIGGELTIGMLVAFQTLLRSFLGPIHGLVQMGSVMQELQGDLNRLDDILMQPVDRRPGPRDTTTYGQTRPVKLRGYIDLKDVEFGYSPLEPPLLSGFNLSVKPGQRIALVGGSGSGKSTLLKLISGEMTQWQGSIEFDEIPRGELPSDLLVNSFSIVDQEIFLFGGTVRDNLTLWDSTVPERNLAEACEDAAVHDVVRSLPGGFSGEIAEGGINLSGGQAQRMEIARALVNNPSILILDEATSALDADTERIVLDRLAARGCTCIIVSHRLSTVRDCDQIIVMKNGSAVERGRHQDLLALDGEYANLVLSDAGPEEVSPAC